MVYRVFVEKKPELANEAKALLNDARNLLGITALENVRLLNCYDAENISKALARRITLSSISVKFCTKVTS